MPVENESILPLRTVTPLWPPTRTPTLSSCGFGQVCGPIPGPVSVWPPRSSTMLSTWMTNASPLHVRSFASTKSVVSCVLHFASRGATCRLGALVMLGDDVGRVGADSPAVATAGGVDCADE